MRGDIPQAAFRLLNQLPVLTHERREYLRPESSGVPGTTAVRVQVGKTVYSSMFAAYTSLHIGDAKLKRMIADGKAKIVK